MPFACRGGSRMTFTEGEGGNSVRAIRLCRAGSEAIWKRAGQPLHCCPAWAHHSWHDILLQLLTCTVTLSGSVTHVFSCFCIDFGT